MMIVDCMFGFRIEVKRFSWSIRRPVPPPGYVPFDSGKAHCQAGRCPNCGAGKPAASGGHGGFQDRAVQNVMRAIERLDRRWRCGAPGWKPMFELFSTDLDPESPPHTSMLKCHPSRYGAGKFGCCGAKIWHDFCDFDEGNNYKKGTWNHYYLPTRTENALKAGRITKQELFQAGNHIQQGLDAFGFCEVGP